MPSAEPSPSPQITWSGQDPSQNHSVLDEVTVTVYVCVCVCGRGGHINFILGVCFGISSTLRNGREEGGREEGGKQKIWSDFNRAF